MSTNERKAEHLVCYENGRRCRLPFEEAHQHFWACDYAWLVPTDFYRWDVEGYSGQVCVRESVAPAARSFGLKIHTRGTLSLTVDDLSRMENTIIDDRTFQKRAARFSKLYGELPAQLRPFFYYRLEPSHGAVAQAAYCMYASRTWFLIPQPSGNSLVDVSEFDWRKFEQPPKTPHAPVEGHVPSSHVGR